MNEQTDPAMRFSEPPPYRPSLAVAGIHEIWGGIERLAVSRSAPVSPRNRSSISRSVRGPRSRVTMPMA